MKKTLRMLLAAAAVAVLGACSAEKGQQQTIDPSQAFPKVTAKMALNHGRPSMYYTLGDKDQPVMRFLLENQDVAAVSVPEWYMNESENICLYYAFCEPGKSEEIPGEDWKTAWPDVDEDGKIRRQVRSRRSGLILQPGNSAVIDVPLTFLETLNVPDEWKGKRKDRYTVALCAQIALNSLDTKSEVFEITVFPRTKDLDFK